MKRSLIYIIGLVMVMGLFLTSCYKETILPEAAVDPDGPPQAVSYRLDIAPLFNTNCAVAGCHVTGSEKPYLTTNESYNNLVNHGYVNTIAPKLSILYDKINGDMKEHIPAATDRQKVYDWIRTGARNN